MGKPCCCSEETTRDSYLFWTFKKRRGVDQRKKAQAPQQQKQEAVGWATREEGPPGRAKSCGEGRQEDGRRPQAPGVGLSERLGRRKLKGGGDPAGQAPAPPAPAAPKPPRPRATLTCQPRPVEDPSNLDSSLCFFQASVSHGVLCIEVK